MYQSLAPMKSGFRVVSQQLIDSGEWKQGCWGLLKYAFQESWNSLIRLGGEIGGSDTRGWDLMKETGQTGDLL